MGGSATTSTAPTVLLQPKHITPRLTDPFWQSTPRSARGHATDAMAAVQKVVASPPAQAVAPAQRAARQAAPTSAARRPQCTHMSMDRLYGANVCHMCLKVPSIGWLYVCQQDRELGQTKQAYDPDSFPIVPNDCGYFEVQAQLAASLGVGASVVQGIYDGDYSFEQTEKLIEQKKHLLTMIRKAENGSAESTPSTMASSVIASAGTTTISGANPVQVSSQTRSAGTPTNTQAASSSTTPSSKPSQGRKQICSFQVCHTCRPFFKDRLYMSFEALLSGELPAVTDEEIARMPILNPTLVRNLGTRQPRAPLPSARNSPDLALQQTDGYEDDTSDWTPTSITISELDSDRLEIADPYPCPGLGHCPLASRAHGCAYDNGEITDGLRALHHGFGPAPETGLARMTPENSLNRLRRVRGSVSDTPGGTSSGSSISLPTISTAPLTPIISSDEPFDDVLNMKIGKGKARTICNGLMGERDRLGFLGLGIRPKGSNSSFGSELEVEGGVALTEEAVERGVPDIVTDDD